MGAPPLDAEVAIVGGGPAGASTALFLLHRRPELRGRVAVLERGRFPREKFCAGALGARAERLLARIGVEVQVPGVPVRGVLLRVADGDHAVREERAVGRVVRRLEFDAALAAEARARGARVLEGVRVLGLHREGDALVLESSGGTLRARCVVGADGVESVVRRALGFPSGRYRAQALEVDTPATESDTARDLLVFDLRRRKLPGYGWDFPTQVEGRPLWCRGVYRLRDARAPLEDGEPELQALLEQDLARRGLSLADCRKKRYAERGFEPHAAAARHGVLLVGEAAGIDPVTGEGIAQAIQYGAAAGAYLGERLPARALRFEDWPRFLAGTSVGRDLALRSLAVRLAYGGGRSAMERVLLRSPEFVQLGLRHFGGARWTSGLLARAAGSTLAALGRRERSPDGGQAYE